MEGKKIGGLCPVPLHCKGFILVGEEIGVQFEAVHLVHLLVMPFGPGGHRFFYRSYRLLASYGLNVQSRGHKCNNENRFFHTKGLLLYSIIGYICSTRRRQVEMRPRQS